ncbi:hydrogenase maturation protein [Streptomyces sp. WM6378]|nr:hydrogenase maturation protein [Streptomyces sp. WM6378]
MLIASAFNSLTQRAHAELREHGHTVGVEIAGDDESLRAAVCHHEPDLLVAPMLKSAVPEDIWTARTCLIVHPGPAGDRGPSSLDWAIHEQAGRWGVTVLQADAEMDAGDVWATETLAVPPVGKSDLYRNEVADAAMSALLSAVERFASGTYRPRAQRDIPEARRPHVRPYFSQERRRIHWDRDTTENVLCALRAADSQPGVLDELLGAEWFLHGGHREHELRGQSGELLATRAGAVCRATADGAVWLPELRPRRRPGGSATFKLPAVTALGRLLPDVPEYPAPGYPNVADEDWSDIRYREEGGAGFLSFSFPGGAMSTCQCRRLLDAYRAACSRPTSVLVLGGNRDFFSNGIHLNVIEAAADPGEESWANIVAMNDLVEAVLLTTDRLVVSAVGGNAAAGGVLLALAADEVWCRTGAVLNPHYRLMGLHGSEYWTYTLPRRVGPETAERLMWEAWPVGAAAAHRMGLVDRLVACGPQRFRAEIAQMAGRLASSPSVDGRIAAKKAERERQEATKPLAAYRQEELTHMRRTFFDPDAPYHALRGAFVRKVRTEGTPAHLAGTGPGRRVIVGGPVGGGVAEVSAACYQRE